MTKFIPGGHRRSFTPRIVYSLAINPCTTIQSLSSWCTNTRLYNWTRSIACVNGYTHDGTRFSSDVAIPRIRQVSQLRRLHPVFRVCYRLNCSFPFGFNNITISVLFLVILMRLDLVKNGQSIRKANWRNSHKQYSVQISYKTIWLVCSRFANCFCIYLLIYRHYLSERWSQRNGL